MGITSYAYCLDYGEKLTATIQAVGSNDKRHIIINRGTDDGVELGDFAEFRAGANKAVIGNAAAIVVRSDRSEWYIYSSFSSQYLNENDNLLLLSRYGINRPEIANLSKLQSKSILLKAINEAQEKFISEERQKEKDRQSLLYKEYELATYNTLDMPNLNVSIKAAPISLRSPNNQYNINYGIDVKSREKSGEESKYLYNGTYQYRTAAYVYNANQDKYVSSKYWSSHSLDRKKIWGDLDYTSLLQYKREHDLGYYPTRYQFTFGLIGLKYPLFTPTQTGIINKFTVSYLPLFEIYSADKSWVPGNKSAGIVYGKESYWRHNLSLEMEVEISSKWKIEEQLQWRPYYNITHNSIDYNNCDLKNSAVIKYEVYPAVTISYQSNLTWDIRKKRNLQLPSTEWENSFYLHYTFSWQDKKI